jgi:hypothetical protein
MAIEHLLVLVGEMNSMQFSDPSDLNSALDYSEVMKSKFESCKLVMEFV